MDERAMAGINIKLAVDSSRDRVLFADAGSDFVDVLLSFLTLPVSAVQFCAGASSPGCLSSLRESVSQLRGSNLLKGDACHGILLRPYVEEFEKPWCDCFRMLVMSQPSEQGYGSDCECWKVMARVAHVYIRAIRENQIQMFVKGKQRFVIGDDLVIKPASTVSTLSMLQKVSGSDRISYGFEEVHVCVRLAEVVSMLKASISSQAVLTKAFLSKESDTPPHVTDNQIIVDPKIQHQLDRDPDSSPHFNIKIFYDRHRKRVMYAECKHDFVDLLLSFLTYPVGSLCKNLGGTSHLGCSLDNLYSSAVDLNVSGLLTGVCCSPQRTLLNPSISPFNNDDFFKLASERTIPEWFNLGRVKCFQCSGDKVVKGCGLCDPQFSRDAAYAVDDDLLIYQASAILVMKHWCKVDKENVVEMDAAISKVEKRLGQSLAAKNRAGLDIDEVAEFEASFQATRKQRQKKKNPVVRGCAHPGGWGQSMVDLHVRMQCMSP
ncbi:Polyubiquitin [Panicum miliaceum]|uniref:Polyubiquitin n=1 Tax=Panicum miliaceum TaxID=4540 RepID=A0A3L6TQC8_PANMI|nr:Polyubiquitin [Panicum miliaceum]